MSGPGTLAAAAGFPAGTVYEQVGDALVPWRFATVDEDYRAIRHDAALIDLSGCGLIGFDGAAGRAVFEASFTADASYMTPERTMTGLIVTDDGRPVDVVTAYRTDDGLLVQTSVGRGGLVEEVMRRRAGEDAGSVTDRRSEFAVMAVEGPKATAVVAEVVADSIEGLPYQAVRTVEFQGRRVIMSRTGFTGEFGYTFLAPTAVASDLWAVLAARATLAGWGAMETAMIEIRQPILNRELLDDDTVVTTGLNWLVDLQKEEFAGREAILTAVDAGAPLEGRLSLVSATPLEAGRIVTLDGEPVGRVVHASFSPTLGAHCAVIRVERRAMASGLDFGFEGGGDVARSVSAPIVVPTSWSTMQG